MKDELMLLKEMVELLEENKLSEVSFSAGDMKLSVKKGSPVTQAFSAQPVLYQSSSPGQDTSLLKSGTDEHANHLCIKSPIAGVFYRAPRPGAEPFVDIGDTVVDGQPVCIVEAMKLFNELTSDVRGKIITIEVENAHVVEEGQVLFYLEKA